MKISIGPIQYFWKRDWVFAFYESLQDSPADTIYLGETVCSKRRELDLDDWLDIAGSLRQAGKEIILSTLSLIESESELSSLRRITSNADYAVEANDMAAIQLLSGRKKFVIGPHINIYNQHSLRLLSLVGASRWVVPMEIGQHILGDILQQRPQEMQVEVFAFGRLPLAFSARCFSARAHNRGKDECGFICGEHTDGILLNTQDNQPFLQINGIQIQSAATCNLIGHYEELVSRGIDILRLSPQFEGMPEIIRILRQVADGLLDIPTAMQQLLPFQTHGSCDGYWNGVPGMHQSSAATG